MTTTAAKPCLFVFRASHTYRAHTKKKKATPAPNGFTLQYCKQLRATVNVTFDLRVPLIQPRFSRVLEYYGCFRARLLHTTVDIPYYTDFVTSKLSFLRSTKFKS